MFDELENVFGKKGMVIVLTVGVGLFIILLLTGNKNNGEGQTVMVSPTAYSSYPDAVTNANVIADSVNKYTEYTGNRVIDAIENQTGSINEYIENGLKELQDSMTNSFDDLDADINDLAGSVGSLKDKVNSMNTSSGTVSGSVVKISSSSSTDDEPYIPRDENGNIKVIPLQKDPKDTTATGPYYAKTTYKGNSIVDGLKSVGGNSSFSNRRDIAKANGIENYKGTASQNTALLNKLKQGTLKKGG